MQCLQSVELDCCPSMEKSYGLVRGAIYRSGHVFMETDSPGVLDCYSVIALQLNGAVPSAIELKMMRHTLSQVLKLDEYFRKRNLVQDGFLPKKELVPKQFANFCSICSSKFNLFTPKRSCQKCGEVQPNLRLNCAKTSVIIFSIMLGYLQELWLFMEI